MKRELVIGAKYFLKDKVLDTIVEVQITQLNEVELSYKRLDTKNEEEVYREIEDIEVTSVISEKEEKKLNKKDVFSVQTDLIRAIVGRSEIMEFSQDNFKKINKDENTVIISITDPDRDILPIEVLSQFKDSLSVQFWDVEEEIGRIKPINKEQAQEIREFIIKNKENNFVIHCEAGMSRSSGIGLACSLICEHNFDRYAFQTSPNPIKEHHRYHPNWVVFDMIIGDR